MNSEQLTSLLRTVLQIAGGIAVSRGYTDDETVTAVIGAVVTLAAIGWSLWARTSTNLVASAAALPEVKQIEALPKIANALGPKVKPAL